MKFEREKRRRREMRKKLGKTGMFIPISYIKTPFKGIYLTEISIYSKILNIRISSS